MKVKTECAVDIWNDVPYDDINEQGQSKEWVHKNIFLQVIKQLEYYARNDSDDVRFEKLVKSIEKDLDTTTP